ncbi:MAG: TolC family protein [bacterium]|nr:TolC family protein [bacterium]
MHMAKLAVGITVLSVSVIGSSLAQARPLTLEEATDIALNRTSRGSVIKGDLEVAEQTYHAKRINFYVPEISLNGSLPSYAEDESYRFFYGSPLKQLYKTNDLGISSFIQLKQALITGGGFEMRANLTKAESEYPNTADPGFFYNERSRQGYFQFSLDQPLLKPSESKYDLNNRKDDFRIAELTRVEDLTALHKEVIEAYIGTLQTSLKAEVADVKFKSARLKAEIDSSKMQDGVISEDTWLASASSRLDAELNQFDAQSQLAEKNRQLAILLDMELSEQLELAEPVIDQHASEASLQAAIAQCENSIAVRKAELQYQKAERSADYAAGAHGLTGSLTANYSIGRGKIEVEGQPNDNINTNSWDVALNVTLPIWDGGASSASVKAARLTSEKSRLEYQKVLKASRSDIELLVNKYNVSYRKLSVLRQQVDLAESKFKIAEERMKNGEISEITYLESKVFLLEAQDKYLGELKNYLLSKADLDGKFVS